MPGLSSSVTTRHDGRMISVVIPTLNSGQALSATLAALVPAAVDGLVKELLVVDQGSTDATLDIADDAGARIFRGQGVADACAAARGDWLMLLRPGLVPSSGWEAPVARHLGSDWARAGCFRLSRDGRRPAWRQGVKGDESLLVSRRLYDEVGGGEGPDLLRRLRGRIDRLDALVTR